MMKYGTWKIWVFLIITVLSWSSVTSQLCGQNLRATGTAQNIDSPGYPESYGTNLDCQWLILSPGVNSYIRVSLESITLPESVDCLGDHIEIWIEGNIDSDIKPERFCGAAVPTWNHFYSEGQQILVRFVSDGIQERDNFNFRLTFITDDDLIERLFWTDQNPANLRVRLNSLAANPHSYLLSGNITTRYFYQQEPGRWLAIANDRRDRSVFWSDSSGNRIIRGSVGAHAVGKAIFTGTSSEVEGIAVDWVAKNLYITDSYYNWILVMSYDGQILLRLVTTELEVPRGIAVHPLLNYLFWTDCGSVPRIERSTLAGEERQVLVSSGLTSPNGIIADIDSERLYWTNAGAVMNTLESSEFDGSDRQILYSHSSITSNFFQLTSYRDYIFISDRTHHLRCIRKSLPTEQYFSLDLTNQPFGITIYATETQPMMTSPCSSNPCSHICINLSEDEYKCICLDGHDLLPDGRTCQEDNAITAPQLFVATQTSLCRWPSNFPTMTIPENKEMSCFLTGRQHAVGLAVDVEDSIIFFSDVAAKIVASASLLDNSHVVPLAGNTKSVEGVAVDWISNNVYWTDNSAGLISVSSYDGRYQVDLITDAIKPRSIAIEPFEKFMFWGEFGPPVQIERADLDGSNRRVILSDKLGLPNAFAIDYDEQMLYFADVSNGAIQKINYDGQEKAVVYMEQESSHNFFGMAFFQDFLIWTEFGTNNGMYAYNRKTNTLVKEFKYRQEAIFGLTMFSEYNQPIREGPCSNNNGGCNQLCLPSSTAASGRTCKCTLGTILNVDGMTCTSNIVEDNFILVADTYLRKVYQVDLTDPTYSPNALTLGPMRNPIAVAYDPVDQKIYWTDVSDHTITRAALNGDDLEIIIHENIETPDGMTVDVASRLLFWTDTGTSSLSISVSHLDGMMRTTLITDGIEKPRAIALNPQQGYMYWSDWGSVAKIERSYYDGTGREALFDTDLGWPNGLTVDIEGGKLYWCDALADNIEVSDLDGSNRRILIDFESNTHPYGIGIYGETLFWADWSLTSLLKANKLDGGNMAQIGSSNLKRPNEIHIYSSDVDVQGPEACQHSNGGCEGICLTSANGRTCTCGDELTLQSDGVSCEEVQCDMEFDIGYLDECTGSTGMACAVNCYTGFTARVPSVACRTTGQWTEDLNTVCEEISCPSLPEADHLSWDQCPPPYSPGHVCVQTCDEGYTLISGDGIIRCDHHGQWIGDIASCGVADVTDLLFTSHPVDRILTVGTILQVECNVNDDSSTIEWFKEGSLLVSSTHENLFIFNNALLIAGVEPTDQGRYSCVASRESDGSSIEAEFVFSIPTETFFITTPENITISEGDNHVLACSARNPAYRIQWEKNGVPVTYTENLYRVAGDNLMIIRSTLSDTGHYKCIIYSESQPLSEVSAWYIVDSYDTVQDVCGTITAEEAIGTDAVPGEDGAYRVVGGHKAIKGSAPWMARLYHPSSRTHFCGASLINNYWVVTAAHCIVGYGTDVRNYLIRIGDYDTDITDDSEVLRAVSEIHLHQGFNQSYYDMDIALLKLDTPFDEFTDYIRPLCFPNTTIAKAMYKVGQKGKVNGWGRIAELGPYPRYMSEVTLPLVGRRRCRGSTTHTVTLNMFCAGYPRASGDACYGDSGGPFSVEHNGRWYLMGIVSWGEGCGQEGKYGFYTRIVKFVEWVNYIINP